MAGAFGLFACARECRSAENRKDAHAEPKHPISVTGATKGAGAAAARANPRPMVTAINAATSVTAPPLLLPARDEATTVRRAPAML
jgi:hypothetical protein